MAFLKNIPALTVNDFNNGDLASIWSKLSAIVTTIGGGDPFAVAFGGSGTTLEPPVGKFWVIENIFFTLTTDANVGNRRVSFVTYNNVGAFPIQFMESPFVQGPSLTYGHSYGANYEKEYVSLFAGVTSHIVNLPKLVLYKRSVADFVGLQINTDNNQLGDVYTNPRILYREFDL